MDRLTKWCEALQEWQENHDNDERKGFQNGHRVCMARLAEYENADEQGLILRLPCKVGDTVYTNLQFQGSYLREKDKPYAVKVVFIGLNGDISAGCGFINVMYSTAHMMQFNFSDIGKTVFLTRADAEKALAEMEDKADDR